MADGTSSATHRLGWSVGVVLLVTALVPLLLLALTRPGAADRFVTRSGTTLRIGGSLFRFVGFNLYDAAASDVYSCSPATRLDDRGLDDAMKSIADSGGTVVRFWAYQTYTDGGRDFAGIDRAVAAARAHGLRVLPVLEDGPGDCSTGPSGVPLSSVDEGAWYATGYRSPLGTASVSFRDYAGLMARHYRDDPTILAWSLVNEAETTQRDPQGRSVLVDFARDVSTVVHDADPNHLVTLGTQANGAPGASGSDFAAVYGLPGMDLAEVHDWASHGSDSEPMPGASSDGRTPPPGQCRSTDAPLACSFTLARELGKPIIVGEAGIAAEDDVTRARRADQLGAKLDAAFAAGASGYLIWQLNRATTDGYAVLIGDNDPIFGVLRTASRRWDPGG